MGAFCAGLFLGWLLGLGLATFYWVRAAVRIERASFREGRARGRAERGIR